MIGWDACIQDPHWLFRQIECHPATAAWAQDVGIILSIIGTAAVATWSARREEHRRKLDRDARAQLLAVQLGPLAHDVRSVSMRKMVLIDSEDANFHLLPDTAAVAADLRLNIGPSESMLARVNDLNYAEVDAIGNMVRAISMVNTYVDVQALRFNSMDLDDRSTFKDNLRALHGEVINTGTLVVHLLAKRLQ